MSPADPRPGWVRQRIYELQQCGLKYSEALAQAETEADEKFRSEENGDNGNGATG